MSEESLKGPMGGLPGGTCRCHHRICPGAGAGSCPTQHRLCRCHAEKAPAAEPPCGSLLGGVGGAGRGSGGGVDLAQNGLGGQCASIIAWCVVLKNFSAPILVVRCSKQILDNHEKVLIRLKNEKVLHGGGGFARGVQRVLRARNLWTAPRWSPCCYPTQVSSPRRPATPR